MKEVLLKVDDRIYSMEFLSKLLEIPTKLLRRYFLSLETRGYVFNRAENGDFVLSDKDLTLFLCYFN